MSISEIMSDIVRKIRPAFAALTPSVVVVDSDARLVLVDPRGPCRTHTLTGVPSMLAFARRHGTPEDSAVYVAADGVRLVLDEVDGGDHSEVRMALQDSTALKLWAEKTGRAMTPVQLRAFLEDRVNDLASKSVLAAVSCFKARVEVEFEADLETDTETVFRLKEGAKGSKAEIPKDFEIAVPLWLGHPTPYKLSIGLETLISKDGPPTFALRFRDLPDVRDVALGDLLDLMSAELAGWLVVRGNPYSTAAKVVLLNEAKA